jgi:cytochrome c oxidase subunit 1
MGTTPASAPAPVPSRPPAPAVSILHPGAGRFTVAAHSAERRVGLLFAVSGVALIALMGVLGIVMRLTQADVTGLSPAWFYRLLTLHGAGMITGALLVMMGAVWYVLRATVQLRLGWMIATYALTVAGVAAVLVATLVGGFGAGWTFLPPLPFHAAGQWPMWSATVFFAGLLVVGAAFCVFCVDLLEQTTNRHGGLAGALGWRFLLARDAEAPPPLVVSAVVVGFCGLIAGGVGSAILAGLLGQTYDSSVTTDALVAKNLVYFFGHSMANLGIYLGAAAIYVLMPRYAGRPYATSKPFIVGWTGSLVFIVIGYSHHLYMDFAQPLWAGIVSEVASYAALLPVAVITIYSMTMLVWGSRYRWTLASTLLYVGLAGWVIGGIGAVIDSLIPVNFRFHNTDWVVAHFHTYELLSVVVWGLAFLAHLLERDADATSSRRARISGVALILIGGYGLTGTWFVAGVLGVPRRYAVQPPGTSGYSLVGAAFALLVAVGFLLVFLQLVPLARAAWRRRHALLAPAAPDGLSGAASVPAGRRGLPLTGSLELRPALAAAVAGLITFVPDVIEASEKSARLHHLDHAGHFFVGAMAGLLVGCLPAISRWLGDRPSLGLVAVLAAPTAMMLVMVPRLYEPLEGDPFQHAGFHLAMAAFGFVTGLGATRLGRVTGWTMLILAVGMPLMFAAAMTGGTG